MADSYFLKSDKSEESFRFYTFGCCEYAGDSLRKDLNNGSIYEYIDTNKIRNDYFKNHNVIEEYVYLVSEFLDIPIERVVTPEQKSISNLSYDLQNVTVEEYNSRVICFKIGKFSSNKHFVAMHTLIRYLWYDNLYNDIVNIVLNIRRYSPAYPIEDVFAIAHSFQDRTSRALTGKSSLNKFGFMYFRPNSEFKKELSKNIMFNVVFDDLEIALIPKIKIKGNFFDDSEVSLDSKSFISFLSSEGSEADGLSEKFLHKVLDTYAHYKEMCLNARYALSKNSNKYRVLKFHIECENKEFIKADIDYVVNATGDRNPKTIKDISKLNELINML